MTTDNLVESNLKLVHMVCQRFKNRGREYDDLFQVGCLGLLKAANRFDESLNFKFSTYAVNMIIGEIRTYLRDETSIKISRKIKENQSKINKFRNEFEKDNGRIPTVEEIASGTAIPAEDVTEAIVLFKPEISIYNETSDGKYLIDSMKSDKNDMTDNIFLSDFLSVLDSRSRNVIKLRYIYGVTQKEISKIFNVSQVQISRIEKSAMNKLKKSAELSEIQK